MYRLQSYDANFPRNGLFSQVHAWIQPVQPSLPLHQCGRCGLRHGWNIFRAFFSTCLKCDRRGHQARMCTTGNSGSVNCETGCFPLYISIYCRMISYSAKLFSGQENKIVYTMYKYLFKQYSADSLNNPCLQ